MIDPLVEEPGPGVSALDPGEFVKGFACARLDPGGVGHSIDRPPGA